MGLPTLRPVTEPFWDRPTRGLRDVAQLLRDTIDDAEMRRGPPVGTVEQWSDNVAVLVDADRRLAATRALWRV